MECPQIEYKNYLYYLNSISSDLEINIENVNVEEYNTESKYDKICQLTRKLLLEKFENLKKIQNKLYDYKKKIDDKYREYSFYLEKKILNEDHVKKIKEDIRKFENDSEKLLFFRDQDVIDVLKIEENIRDFLQNLMNNFEIENEMRNNILNQLNERHNNIITDQFVTTKTPIERHEFSLFNHDNTNLNKKRDRNDRFVNTSREIEDNSDFFLLSELNNRKDQPQSNSLNNNNKNSNNQMQIPDNKEDKQILLIKTEIVKNMNPNFSNNVQSNRNQNANRINPSIIISNQSNKIRNQSSEGQQQNFNSSKNIHENNIRTANQNVDNIQSNNINRNLNDSQVNNIINRIPQNKNFTRNRVDNSNDYESSSGENLQNIRYNRRKGLNESELDELIIEIYKQFKDDLKFIITKNFLKKRLNQIKTGTFKMEEALKSIHRNKIKGYAKLIIKFKEETELNYDSPIIKLLNNFSKKYALSIRDQEIVIHGIFDRIIKFLEIYEINKDIYDVQSASIECYNFSEDLFSEVIICPKIDSNIEESELDDIKQRYIQLEKLREFYKKFKENLILNRY